MGVIVLCLVVTGHQSSEDGVPLWVKLAAAGAISAGTCAGGWRIIRTLGRRVIQLDPARGFAAETTAAGVLYTTAFIFAAPISTTHTITSAILGAGATKRLSAVRWGVAGKHRRRVDPHDPDGGGHRGGELRRPASGRLAEAAGDVVLGALVARVAEDLRGRVVLDEYAAAFTGVGVGLSGEESSAV